MSHANGETPAWGRRSRGWEGGRGGGSGPRKHGVINLIRDSICREHHRGETYYLMPAAICIMIQKGRSKRKKEANCKILVA